MYEYHAVCTKVVDGDTVELEVDLGFHIRHTIRGRLSAVNAPELFSGAERDKGLRAKQKLEEYILGKTVLVRTVKDRTSFGRWIVNLWSPDMGQNVNYLMENFVKTL